ncbi:hypothetical protein RvY_00933 [Ramazzottius varieornatus]|uniref:glutathione transferase n=1 Tax=Ramazzottius varieornatus TaxID=947166 RepID=A0A1D1UEI3_RAMVA|nr:hypothetical protein RvY_00933 [Ramazzottius varieornatus]
MARNDPHYKLTYFNFRGLAEPIRFLFAYAKVDYEDNRITHEEWPAIKKTTPFRTLPILEVDGQAIGESNAIGRLLAKRFNLYGKDDIEQAKVDALVDFLEDVKHAGAGMVTIFREPDEKKKQEMKDKFFSETLPDYIEVLEQHLKNNNGGKGYFVGNSPTWADISIAVSMDRLDSWQPGSVSKYPLLAAHNARVEGLEGIKDWIAKRPKTPM